MNFSPAALQQYLPAVSSGVWWVGLSGGLDSCVLLHSLVALELPVQLHALHINHQISPHADNWQAHCAELCAKSDVAFSAVKVQVKNSGRGLEDAARAARYDVFEQHLKPGDLLFTAHHVDDQTETLLLRLMRGTGPRGLAAMASVRNLGVAQVYRPLLSFTRMELAAYAEQEGLRWVDDESNTNDQYDRNFLRNQVMPLLRERWPQFAKKWQQTADLCAANEQLIEELAAQDFILADIKPEPIGSSISLEYFQHLSHARRHNLLRYWLRTQNLSVPEQQHIVQIEQQIITGRQDAETQVNWAEVSLRVYRGRLFVLRVAELPSIIEGAMPATISLKSSRLRLSSGACLEVEETSTRDGLVLKSDLPNLSVRFRRGGERCRPAGRSHSQTLKRLLQEYAVAPWLRDSWPLIYSNDELVAVAGLWICEGYVAEAAGYWLKYNPKAI